MGRRPCCTKENVKKGAWSTEEDQKLVGYVKLHGEGRWRKVAQNAGLNRCGKSCRLRWLNYLRPGIKIGNFTNSEEELIVELRRLHGNRWALIAGRLPGRTDNEIKNYWNTVLSKKLKGQTPRSSLRKHKSAKKRVTIDSLGPSTGKLHAKEMKAVCNKEDSISLEDNSQTTINTNAQINDDSQSLESSTTSLNNTNSSLNHDSQDFISADAFSSNMTQAENSGMQELGDDNIENDIFSICRDSDISAVLSDNAMRIYEFDQPLSLNDQMKQLPCFLEIENEWRDLW